MYPNQESSKCLLVGEVICERKKGINIENMMYLVLTNSFKKILFNCHSEKTARKCQILKHCKIVVIPLIECTHTMKPLKCLSVIEVICEQKKELCRENMMHLVVTNCFQRFLLDIPLSLGQEDVEYY